MLYGSGSTFKPVTAMATLGRRRVRCCQVFNAMAFPGIKDWVILTVSSPATSLKEARVFPATITLQITRKVGTDRLSEWTWLGLASPLG